ncbi:MAG: hypothetical protein J2P41_22865 [Blastocatellia bacterium]|nr:hypothetical protein [Blastocatellia bacterium]
MEAIPAPTVRWGEWISEGWDMFVQNWKVWVLQTLIMSALFVIPAVFFYILIFASIFAQAISGQNSGEYNAGLPPIFLAGIFVVLPVVLLASVFLTGGLWRTATKQMRGKEISVGDLFSAGDVYLRLLGATILLGLLGIIGAAFCFFPALIVFGLFHFTIPLIVDRDMSIGDAMTASFNATKSHWIVYTLFAIVVSLIAQAGAIFLYIGLLATFPLQFTIFAIAYRDTFGIQVSPRIRPYETSTSTSYAGQPWPGSAQQWAEQGTPPPNPPRPLFTETAESQVSWHCPHCGAVLNRSVKFCNVCGGPQQS